MSNTVVSTTVKWGKESISLDLIPSEGVKGLKTTLEEKTGVPKDRMKIMPKSKGLWKGVLRDDFDLTSIDFAAIPQRPIALLLMGSATQLAGPKVKTVFVEDMTETEVAQVTPEPSGLANLGNTCYLNSVTQCLRAIPLLRKGLSSYVPSSEPNPSAQHSLVAANQNRMGPMVVSSLRDLYGQLDGTTQAVQPMSFVMAVKMAFPQFNQRGPRGQPMQQDAEEFYSAMMAKLAEEITGVDKIRAALPETSEEELQGAANLVDAVFGMKMEETLSCDETAAAVETTTEAMKEGDGKEEEKAAGESTEAATAAAGVSEPVVTSYDLHRKLVCNIQGGSDSSSQVNVSHIAEGIDLSLNGTIVKHSEVLGRDASWTRKQRICRLPPILVVQFGRFYWKATPDSQDHAGVKCKVMKPVAFTDTLDVYDFCTPKVQEVLKVARDLARAEEEDEIAKKLQGQRDAKEAAAGAKEGESKMEAMDTEEDAKPSSSEKTEEATMTEAHEENEEEKAALEAALAMSVQKPVGPGLPPRFQGKYELFAVVTHKGRDADGGHYMGWVKAENQPEKKKEEDEMPQKGKKPAADEGEDWYVFDDDHVSPCKTENILQLKGGGDWHMSYLNFYRAFK